MIERLIKGAHVVTPAGVDRLEVGITNGVICGLYAPHEVPQADEIICAEGLWLLPGAIDAHTHFTAHPFETEIEFAQGTAGAAAGGVTCVIEMPHSLPPVTDLASFAHKKALCDENAMVDFALWAGLTADNLDELPKLHAAGALGFKGFLCSPRADGAAPDPTALPALGDGALLAAMQKISELDALIAIHAENHDILYAAKERLMAAGRDDMRAHAQSGPELAEIEAVQRLMLFAQATRVKIHVVHMASARAVDLLSDMRGEANVSAETCMHYLCLDEEDLVTLGPIARCGPPLRPRAVADALWERLMSGKIDILASDHCPYPIQDKSADLSVWQAGMGLTGVQTNVPLLMSEGVIERGLPLNRFAQMTASAPAKRFGLANKGEIRIGYDADLTLWDPKGQKIVKGGDFYGRAKFSAFEGRTLQGCLLRTLCRGKDVYLNGEIVGQRGWGQFQRPNYGAI